MPLGNLTSQFFANLYLHDLDYFVKHVLKVKYYIRYVDDFVILHKSAKQLELWKSQIEKFLNKKLMIRLHPAKSRIISIKRGIDFIGFRNFYHYRLLRKKNIRNMRNKVRNYEEGSLCFGDIHASYKGWQAHARWANSERLREKIKMSIIDILLKRI